MGAFDVLRHSEWASTFTSIHSLLSWVTSWSSIPRGTLPACEARLTTRTIHTCIDTRSPSHYHSPQHILIMKLVGGVQDTSVVPGSPLNPFIPRSPLVPLSPIHPLGPLSPCSPSSPGGPGSPLGWTTPAIMNTITQSMHSGEQCTAMACQLESHHEFTWPHMTSHHEFTWSHMMSHDLTWHHTTITCM